MHISLLSFVEEQQSYLVVDTGEPYLTYKSASPVVRLPTVEDDKMTFTVVDSGKASTQTRRKMAGPVVSLDKFENSATRLKHPVVLTT